MQLKEGMIVSISGENIIPEENHLDNEFNYRKYLAHKRINGVIKADKIEIIAQRFSLFLLSRKIHNYFSNIFSGMQLAFIKALLLGDSGALDKEFVNSLTINGTLHLFAISGLHITLFIAIIGKGLEYFKINEKLRYNIIICFLGFYLIITRFSPSIIRASLMYILGTINKRFDLKLSSLDIISIIYLFLIILNPYYMYHLGFVLSFLVAFMIILLQPILPQNEIKQIFLIPFFSQIITLPITINLNNEINLLAPITNIFFIILMEIVILPLTILIIFLPFCQHLYYLLILSFTNLSIFISKYFSIILVFRNFNPVMIILYYGILLLIIKYYHHYFYKIIAIIVYLLFLLCLYYGDILIPYGEVYFFDLYNGEAILITEPFNHGKILIDTGDGTNQAVTKFLKSRGIKKLDLVIITHNHHDHNGELPLLLRHFHINKIVTSAYYNSEITNLPNVIKVKAGSTVKCGKLVFHVLHPDKHYLDENDNSIVLYTQIGGLKYLFLGDITKNIEMKFSHLDVDVLKIAHHGSNTSTSSAFIKSINPKYAIIQTGRIEKFGFPHQEVITILKKYNVIVYRTDRHYSIKIKYSQKKRIFKTLR